MTTATCPQWCTTVHTSDLEDAEHLRTLATFEHNSSVETMSDVIQIRAFDTEAPSVVVAGTLWLNEAQAHELGMALVRAADFLRREARR